jgi:uncharacterized protein (TIGR04255 family)
VPLVVERIGLRYVNAIKPRPNELWKDYVKPGYHGWENHIIQSENSVCFMQTVADTGPAQRMIIRLVQNRDGQLLPPDLVPHHPILRVSAEQGKLLTLLDLDHYREAREPFENERVLNITRTLHEELEIMFRGLVTSHALTVWRQ